MAKGIDLSYHNGSVDFAKVKAQGYDFVMLRIGYRGYGDGSLNKDKNFETYYRNAKANGLYVGAYFFSQAITILERKAEAEFCFKVLGNRTLDYPLAFDTELSGSVGNVGRADRLSKELRTQIVKEFCECVERNNFYRQIYCSESWLKNNLDYKQLLKYDKWIAKWSIFKPTTSYGTYGIWQNSNNGRVNGVTSARTDTNISYYDYPNIMKSKGLNNYGTPVKYTFVANGLTVDMADKFVRLSKELDVTDYKLNEV